MAYITKAELEAFTGEAYTGAEETLCNTVISAVQRFIENLTHRKFEGDDATTRYYNGNGNTRLRIDNVRSITSVTVDGVALTENDDYITYPLNATADSKPIEAIELIQPEQRLNANSRVVSSAPYVFEIGQRNVAVTGKFTYSATAPADIKVSALKLAGTIMSQRTGSNATGVISSESIGDYTISYGSIANISEKIGTTDILSQYILPDANSAPQTKAYMRQVS